MGSQRSKAVTLGHRSRRWLGTARTGPLPVLLRMGRAQSHQPPPVCEDRGCPGVSQEGAGCAQSWCPGPHSHMGGPQLRGAGPGGGEGARASPIFGVPWRARPVEGPALAEAGRHAGSPCDRRALESFSITIFCPRTAPSSLQPFSGHLPPRPVLHQRGALMKRP